MKLKRLLLGGFLAITSFSQAQCPEITCPSDITVSTDPGSCDAVVTFTAPQGTDPCNTGSVTFTNCGITGRYGPTQGDVNTEYSGGPLDGDVTINTQGVQEWTVPHTGTYTIQVAGAAGGGTGGGLGAEVQGEFNLTAGEVIKIIVGQRGQLTTQSPNYCAGGGGGSYVFYNATDALPLIVAGGGGGQSELNYGNIADGGEGSANSTVTTGNSVQGNGPGGTNGDGGSGGLDIGDYSTAGGGAGWLTDGQNGLYLRHPEGQGGLAPQNGAIGGTFTHPDYFDAHGGFGGGGSAADNSGAGGGGGGFNGGGGGNNYGGGGQWGSGGGAGSYNTGSNPVSTAGANSGHGYVNITWTGGNATTTQTAGLSSGSTFPVGTTVQTFEATDANGGNPVTCSFNVTVTSAVDVNVSVNELTITADNSNADTYQWIDCSDDSPISGETSQSFTATANGDYAVIISEGNCTDTSACQTISTVGTDSYNMAANVVVYPNPNDGQFTVNFGQKVAEAEINIIDVQGRTVETYNVNSVSAKEIDMTEYSGAYMINVATENENQTFRVIIQK